MCIRRPDPQWHIVVDSWLSLPYPDWYVDYFLAHFQPGAQPLPFLAAYSAAAAPSSRLPESSPPSPEVLPPLRFPAPQYRQLYNCIVAAYQSITRGSTGLIYRAKMCEDDGAVLHFCNPEPQKP